MKNQYFGDVNDYRKYGLLRCLLAGNDLRLLVAWMLTLDDGRTDGRFIRYLGKPERHRHHDPELFDTLKAFLAGDAVRRVSQISQSSLLSRTGYFRDIVPDPAGERSRWFAALKRAVDSADIVFLDPDNGFEVKSVPYGRKGSSKYVFWDEVETLASAGKSLVIYQHFRRVKRVELIAGMEAELRERTGLAFAKGMRTSHVLFLVAAQDAHRTAIERGLDRVRQKWAEQIS